MFFGHIPASYLWTRYLFKSRPIMFGKWSTTLAIGLMAGVFPDLDLIYFYLVDHHQYLHHEYWTHIPFFWLIAIGIWLVTGWITRRSSITIWGIVFGSNILLHLVLDTVAGKIRWFYPFLQRDYALARVPSIYGWWVLNFLLHWTFLAELALLTIGFIVWWRDTIGRTNRMPPTPHNSN